MPDQVRIAPDDLHTHASKVDGVADRIGTAVEAAQQVTLDNDAYGILCRPFAWMLDPVEKQGVEALKRAAEAMRETAENVRTAADEYRTVDEGNSDAFRRLQA
jgi:uncharacterized protein YukE